MEYYTDYISASDESEYKSKSLGTVDIAYSPSITASSDLGIRLLPEIKLHLISKFVGKQYFDNTMNEERTIDPYFVNNLRSKKFVFACFQAFFCCFCPFSPIASDY